MGRMSGTAIIRSRERLQKSGKSPALICDPYDMRQGALSKRVHYLKCKEGGINYMCEVPKKLFNDGWLEGQRPGFLEGKREVAVRLFAKGMTDGQPAGGSEME